MVEGSGDGGDGENGAAAGDDAGGTDGNSDGDDAGEDSTAEVAHVRATYDRIAEHFAETRANPWPEVEDFLAGRRGTVGLDVGCGNGRHTALLADRCDRAVGVDLSRAVLDTAVERAGTGDRRSLELLQGEATGLPVSSAVVDLALFVATLPHLPSRAQRLASLDELARVLDPDGSALVSAWSTEHDRFDADEGFDATVGWTLPNGETVGRFYHIYDPDEFRADVAASELELVDFEVSSGNCYGVVRVE